MNSENSLTDVMVAHPDSKLCLAVHLLNEHCTTSEHTELYFIYFYVIIFNLFNFILNQHLNIFKLSVLFMFNVVIIFFMPILFLFM